MQRFVFFLAIMFCTCSLVFSQAGWNTRYVAVQNAGLKSSAGFFSKSLGNLSLGDEVTLVTYAGKWSQVRAGNLTGWMASSSLSVRKVVSNAQGVSGGVVVLAGKGFSHETELEYRKNGLDYSMVDSMEQITVPNNDLLHFVNEGRLSRGD